jgi:hypothetical protein
MSNSNKNFVAVQRQNSITRFRLRDDGSSSLFRSKPLEMQFFEFHDGYLCELDGFVSSNRGRP